MLSFYVTPHFQTVETAASVLTFHAIIPSEYFLHDFVEGRKEGRKKERKRERKEEEKT